MILTAADGVRVPVIATTPRRATTPTPTFRLLRIGEEVKVKAQTCGWL
jgi:hypothetical protein